MAIAPTRRNFLLTSTASVATACCGCGTLLHSERIGRPRSTDIDWNVAALDGLGLLLFFVPGVVAFAVDFYNGTIYLPAGQHSQIGENDGQKLVQIKVPRRQLDRNGIQATVSDHVGDRIELVQGRYETEQLDAIEQFWERERRLRRRHA